VSQRRVVPLALLVTALLAVVAIAAGGHPLGKSAGHGNGLPVSFWDYVYTSLVILAVPVLFAVLLANLLLRPERTKRRSFVQRLLLSLLVVAAVLAFEVLVLRHLYHRFHLHNPTRPPAKLHQAKSSRNGQHPAAGAHTLRFQWDELAIVLGLLLVLVATAIVVLRRSRPDPKTPYELAPEALAAALDESLDDLRSDPDLRRAIIAAYARMETALAAAGLPRRPAEAPLEYLERALLGLDASAGAVRRLTDLFEWARFSQHEPEPSMRDDAVEALIAVRDELRASELAPA
jgi:Domain of unknown function (DUF4129)